MQTHMAKRRRREYRLLLDKSKAAAETTIDQFNRVRHPYRNETTLILLANAWELLSKAVFEGDMVRIVPVGAPKNYTADIRLSKGNPRDSSLPVIVKRTDLEQDYPYLTKEIGEKLGMNTNFVAHAMLTLGLKGNTTYHQEVRSSKSGSIQRYSAAALERPGRDYMTIPGSTHMCSAPNSLLQPTVTPIRGAAVN